MPIPYIPGEGLPQTYWRARGPQYLGLNQPPRMLGDLSQPMVYRSGRVFNGRMGRRIPMIAFIGRK